MNYIQEKLPLELKIGKDEYIPCWFDQSFSFKNKNIGVFGSTNTGKTTIVASLLFELSFPIVILFSNDANEDADLGKFLPKHFICGFDENSEEFLTKIIYIQQERKKFYEKLIKSEELEKIINSIYSIDEKMREEIDDLPKKINKKSFAIKHKKLGAIKEFQFFEKIKMEGEKEYRNICFKYLITYWEKNSKSSFFQKLSAPLKALISGSFSSPEIAIVFDDFGNKLLKNSSIDFLVTISRKLDITLVFIAQCARNLSSTIRDNLALVIPTTINAALWVSQYILKQGANKAFQEKMEKIFLADSFYYPFINVHHITLSFIGVSVWGKFSLISKEVQKTLKALPIETKLEITILKLSGLKLSSKKT